MMSIPFTKGSNPKVMNYVYIQISNSERYFVKCLQSFYKRFMSFYMAISISTLNIIAKCNIIVSKYLVQKSNFPMTKVDIRAWRVSWNRCQRDYQAQISIVSMRSQYVQITGCSKLPLTPDKPDSLLQKCLLLKSQSPSAQGYLRRVQ